MPLYFISDNDGSFDWFVTAPDALHAFVLWREGIIIEDEGTRPEDLPDRWIEVFLVPSPKYPDQLLVIPWPHNGSWGVALNANTLAMQAIAAALRAPPPGYKVVAE